MAASNYRATALKATATLVKGTTTELLGRHVFNQDSTDTFLHFYDAATAAAVTVGTTTPTMTLWVPGSSGIDDLPTAMSSDVSGIRFTLGLVVAATTTVGGSTNPTNGLLVNLVYV